MAKSKKTHLKTMHKGQEKKNLVGKGIKEPRSTSDLSLLFGIHAVLSALENPQRQIHRLLLTHECRKNLIDRIDQALSIGVHSNIKIQRAAAIYFAQPLAIT